MQNQVAAPNKMDIATWRAALRVVGSGVLGVSVLVGMGVSISLRAARLRLHRKRGDRLATRFKVEQEIAVTPTGPADGQRRRLP